MATHTIQNGLFPTCVINVDGSRGLLGERQLYYTLLFKLLSEILTAAPGVSPEINIHQLLFCLVSP